MTKPTKNKIGLALLACCLIAVCSCLGLTALANTQRYEFSFANGQTLLQEYTVGDVVTIPDGLFEGTTTLQATKKVVYPNGLTVTTNQITLSAVGKYKVVYQANVDDETITETKTFNVYYKKYEDRKSVV